MHTTKFTHITWNIIRLWAILTLILGMPAFGQGAEGEDCDEFWSTTDGPLEFFDNCEYLLGTGEPLAQALPEGSVSQNLTEPCPGQPARPVHRLVFRFSIDASQVNTSFGDTFGIFELWDDDSAFPERLIYVEITDQGVLTSKKRLVLNWRADDSNTGQETPLDVLPSGNSILEVEWTRSYDGNNDGNIDDNGFIRLFLDDSLIAEVTELRFEDRLPASVHYGVFEANGTGIEGRFKFRPIDYSSRYYRNQGPESGL